MRLLRMALVLTLVTGRALAAEAHDGNARELAGHVFPVSRLVRMPFTPTSLGVAAGVAYGSVEAPTFNVLGMQIGREEYPVAALGHSVEGTVRLWDFLALRLDLEAAAYTGVDAPAALVVGASAFGTGGFGVTLAKRFGSHLQLAAVLDAGYRPSFDITVVPSLIASIQQRQFATSDLVVDTRRWLFGAGAAFALTLAPPLGIMGDISYVHPRTKVAGQVSNADDLATAIQIDFDFGRFTPVPIAVVGAYRTQFILDTQADSRVQEVSAGLYYTGRSWLVAGIDVSGLFTSLRPQLDTRALFGTFSLKYFWQ